MSAHHPNAAYPQAQPVYAAARPTNALAVVTLVLGLCGLAVIPIITGHVALRQIRERGDGGSAAAVVGLVLGYLSLAAYVVVLLALTGLVVWGGSQ